MQVAGVAARQIIAELADRLEERQAFDVADRATDFDKDEVELVIALDHEVLDGVGDVRNNLNGGSQIFAAALLGENVGIDAASGDVVALGGGTAGEALVVT